MDFEIDPFLRLNPHKLGLLLEREVSQQRAMLADAQRALHQLDDPAGIKRWLARMRREQQAQGADSHFDLPL